MQCVFVQVLCVCVRLKVYLCVLGLHDSEKSNCDYFDQYCDLVRDNFFLLCSMICFFFNYSLNKQ